MRNSADASVAERARAAAVAAFGWVESVAVGVEGGRAWTEGGVVDDSLYSGSIGVLLACAEATAAGLEAPALTAVASLARDRVLHLAHAGDVTALGDDGLFSGGAGAAVALRAWAAVSGDEQAAAGADLVTSGLVSRAATPSADACTDVISGDAGRLVALVTAPPTGATLTATGVVADRLVAAGEDGPDGPQWRMTPGYPILMPNFSHGTAGVAYALALAGRALDRPDLVSAAVRGAETLLALGQTPPGWALPMTIPAQSHRPPVAFGWCHGPSGTVRLFELLDTLDPSDARWRETVAQCYEAVRTSGLPTRREPGFWDNVARCCGTAGVGSMALDRYQATGDPAVLAWADELAGDVLSRTITTAHGGCWSNTEHTVSPSELPPEPGFLQGAAGIAGWLARLAAVHDDPHAPAVDLGVVPRWI